MPAFENAGSGAVFFSREINLHVSLLNTGGGGCQGKAQLLLAKQKGSVCSGAGLTHINTDIILVLKVTA